MVPLACLFKREWLSLYRQRSEWLHPLLFFLIATGLFPLATSPKPALLEQMGGGVIWVMALLALLLVLPRLFQPDYKDGTLQEWVLSPTSPRVWVSMKLLAYWLMMAVPLMVLTPIVGILFHLSSTAIEVLVISLVLGTPSLWLVGALLAALTVSVEGKPMLISLVVLPLLTPVLMLGTLSVQKASQGLGYRGELGLLGAVLALALTLLPTLIGYLLRVMVLE